MERDTRPLYGGPFVKAWHNPATGEACGVWYDCDSESPRREDYAANGCEIIGLKHPRHDLGDRSADRDEIEEIRAEAEAEGAVVVPWYVYEHGGIAIHTTPGGPMTQSRGFGGIAVVDAREAKKMGKERAEAMARGEVEHYGEWVRGNCFVGVKGRIERCSLGHHHLSETLGRVHGFIGATPEEAGVLDGMEIGDREAGGLAEGWVEGIPEGWHDAVAVLTG